MIKLNYNFKLIKIKMANPLNAWRLLVKIGVMAEKHKPNRMYKFGINSGSSVLILMISVKLFYVLVKFEKKFTNLRLYIFFTFNT